MSRACAHSSPCPAPPAPAPALLRLIHRNLLMGLNNVLEFLRFNFELLLFTEAFPLQVFVILVLYSHITFPHFDAFKILDTCA